MIRWITYRFSVATNPEALAASKARAVFGTAFLLPRLPFPALTGAQS